MPVTMRQDEHICGHHSPAHRPGYRLLRPERVRDDQCRGLLLVLVLAGAGVGSKSLP